MSNAKTDEKMETKPVRVAAVPAKKIAPGPVPKRRPAMPAKEVRSRTVKGKIAYYQSAARKMLQAVREMQAGVRAVESGIKEQMNKNKEAVDAIHSGVHAIQSGINEQIKENLEYVKKFYG